MAVVKLTCSVGPWATEWPISAHLPRCRAAHRRSAHPNESGRSAWAARPSLEAPLRSLLSARGDGWKRIDPRSQISVAPPSPQCSNLCVGPQFPLHIVTAGPEDDASGTAGLELGETFAQLLASPCKGHLFGGGYVDKRIMAVRNVE